MQIASGFPRDRGSAKAAAVQRTYCTGYIINEMKGMGTMDQIVYIIGQLLGIVAIALGFLSYQMKSRDKLVFVQFATAVCFVLHYLMIGAYSGMALNVISVIRNLTYYQLGRKGPVKRYWAVIFSVVMGIVGIVSWQSWYSVFAVLGLIINSYCMSFSDPQSIRKSILVTSPMVLLYDCFVLSIGGIVYESVAIVSAVVGVCRYAKEKARKE